MRRLVCVFVVRKPPKTVILASRPIYKLVASIRNKLPCAYSEDLNQSGLPHSLISLCFPPEETLDPWLPIDRLAKTFIRMRWCAGWSESRWAHIPSSMFFSVSRLSYYTDEQKKRYNIILSTWHVAHKHGLIMTRILSKASGLFEFIGFFFVY